MKTTILNISILIALMVIIGLPDDAEKRLSGGVQMTLSNDTSVEYAVSAVTMYALKKEGHNHYDTSENIAGDLMTDLLHLIRARGGDPDAKLRMAKMNFEAEEAKQQLTQELTL